MIERLQGIVIEVVIGQVLYDGKVVKNLHAESLEVLIAEAKAYINSQYKEQRDPSLWKFRYK